MDAENAVDRFVRSTEMVLLLRAWSKQKHKHDGGKVVNTMVEVVNTFARTHGTGTQNLKQKTS